MLAVMTEMYGSGIEAKQVNEKLVNYCSRESIFRNEMFEEQLPL